MLFKTKRFIYDVLEKNVLNKPGCNAIIGSRMVGKTVVMMQLCEDNKSNSIYKDVSSLDSDFDFNSFFEYCRDNKIYNVFFDEVCKLNEDLIGDFITYTRLYAGDMCIVITGSVGVSVSTLNSNIGRGGDYELPPIMYIERLLWSKGIDSITSESIKCCSTYDLFIDYIKKQNSQSIKEHEDYIVSVVKDTLESYLRNTSVGDRRVNISVEEIKDAVKYISFCQMVYKKDNGTYVDVPAIGKNIRDSLKEDYKVYKQRWNLNSDKIKYVCEILQGCYLAKGTYIFRGEELSLETLKLDDLNVSACIFEYPWLASICISEKLRDLDDMLDIWIENAILLRESNIYPFADKVRSGIREIDSVYGIGYMSTGGYYGLEVKNRPGKNLNRKYLDGEKEYAMSLGLKGIDFTSSDDSEGYLRLDKVVASLELEYVNMMLKGEVRCDSNIKELVTKYFN